MSANHQKTTTTTCATTPPSLATTVGGIRLATCIYNASGPRTGSAAALAKIAASSSGAVLTKSATLLRQNGNPQPRTWHAEYASFNSEGLPNYGIDYYLQEDTIQEAMLPSCSSSSSLSSSSHPSKPYMVSISGKTLEDNLEMLQRIERAVQNNNRIAAVELNLACPNVIGKPIIGYDMEQLRTVLQHVSTMPLSIPLGIKLPPYLDISHFQQVAQVINEYPHVVRFVVSINTIGNALAVDSVSEAPVICANHGLAGLSGRAVKYTALANVRQLRLYLDPSIDIVGVGGVETGEDVFELLLCGASAVQVGTTHWKEGPACFDRLCQELQDLMNSKDYHCLDDFKGKLKPWSKEGVALARTHSQQPSGKSDVKAQTTMDMSSSSNSTSRGDFCCTMSAVLVVVIAILLADKFGVLGVEES
jgi:dihydroorotate dehydrogenase (fumarate)